MSVTIQALYIFNETKSCLLEHTFTGRPPKPQDLSSRYYSHPVPRPSILYFADLNPPTTAYSVQHANLVLLCTSSVDVQSLAVLEFIYRIIDILEEFLGSPLLASKIEDNYEIIAQVLAEVCDGGIICNTETNALQDVIELSSALGKLFTQVGLAGSSSTLGPTGISSNLKTNTSAAMGPAIPWRRPNVRHTSNELYVDIVESLTAIFAPSGRPIAARSQGSIAFTAKISGVPDLVLTVTAPGGSSTAKGSGILRTMQLPVFHPCVRLARWKEHPGEFSFIPPDGKFMLAGYEVDLLPSSLNIDRPPSQSERLFLPATVDLKSGLGAAGTEFEARLTLNNNFPGVSSARPVPVGPRAAGSSNPFSFGSASNTGSSTAPVLENVLVSIPLPNDVRNVTDLKASRGEATYDFAKKTLEWKVPTKDGFSVAGTATLTGNVLGPQGDIEDLELMEETEDDAIEVGKSRAIAGYYDDGTISSPVATRKQVLPAPNTSGAGRQEIAKKLMPKSVLVSFSVKGWLPSGIKVDSLVVDTKKSRGLGEGVKPYKGVKYLTVSRKGVERRL